MDFQTDSLLQEITNVDNECGEILKDAGIVEDGDLQSLCYESLRDIFPGDGKKIVQRSKVWKIIQKSLKTTRKTSTSSSPSVSTSVDLTDDHSDSSFFDNSIVEVSTPKHAKSVKVEHPEYSVYVDQEIRAASLSHTMSSELKSRLVRATIHNMISAAASPPFSRYPLTMEIEEMAKSLMISYPCLRDPETGHHDLFKKLKRKLSNSKPTKKSQGPCPKKKRKETASPKEEKQATSSKTQKQSDGSSLSNDGTNDPSKVVDNAAVLKRHYKLLEKEMHKKKPDVEIVNKYLDKEFEARRNWLTTIPPEERCKMLLEAYPCFTDHVEVIEEVRRILKVETTERSQFVSECVGRLTEELYSLMFYGISKGIHPPQSPKLRSRIVHVLNKLSSIFPRPKPLKKTRELIHELQDHEDPDTYFLKQVGNMPVLVLDHEIIYVIVGKNILFQTELENMAEAVVAFLGSFYLLDFDYPQQHELGLLMLQTIVFKDERIPSDVSHAFEGITKAFKKYKTEST